MQTTSVLCYPSWWLNAKPMSLKNCASPPPPRKTPYEVITLKQAHQTLFRLSSCSVCFCLMLWHVFGETWCAFPLPLFLYVSASTRHVRIYVSLYIYDECFYLKKETNRNKGGWTCSCSGCLTILYVACRSQGGVGGKPSSQRVCLTRPVSLRLSRP